MLSEYRSYSYKKRTKGEPRNHSEQIGSDNKIIVCVHTAPLLILSAYHADRRDGETAYQTTKVSSYDSDYINHILYILPYTLHCTIYRSQQDLSTRGLRETSHERP